MYDTDVTQTEIIEDVHQSTLRYLGHHWGWKFFAPTIALVFFAFFYAIGQWDAGILILPVVWIIIWYVIAHKKVEREFMQQFARANNFEYYESGIVSSMNGALFERGHSKSISHLTVGKLDTYTIHIFYYRFSEGHGDGKKMYDFTVSKIIFPGEAPDVLVESRGIFSIGSLKRKHQKEIPIESAFRDRFTVYVPENFEIEALEIFTPEILSTLLERAKGYSFEFLGNTLYIFIRGTISHRTALHQFLDLAKYLMRELGPRLLRLEDDVRAMKNIRAEYMR